MLMMSFDDALTRANFSFVYFLQFYLLNFFDIFQWGFEPPTPPPLATPLVGGRVHTKGEGTPGSGAIEADADLRFTRLTVRM